MQTLGDFGHTFQTKVLSALFRDKEFAARLYDSYEPNFFESESVRWLVKHYFSYFIEYKEIPTLDYFKAEMIKVTDDTFKSELVSNLRVAWNNLNSTDLDYVKKSTTEFCQNQAIKEAIIKSVDLLKAGKIDEIKVLIDIAMRKGRVTDTGLNYKVEVDRRYLETTRNTIGTGWPVIDDLFQGGLASGNLGVVVAPAGIGKTWVLAHLGGAAISAGKTVFHYTLELDDDYVGRRYDAILTGIGMNSLEHHVDLIKAKMGKIEGELHIFRYPPRKLSVVGLNAHIQTMTLMGIKPDMIIIDYADLMKVDSIYSRDDLALKALYEDLRALSYEVDAGIWTASQTNREGSKESVVEADSISDSYGKVMTADFVLSVSRKINDKANNTARINIIKNRYGIDGLVFPCTFNTLNGLIQVHDERTHAGQEARKDMADARTIVANRYKDLFSKNPGDKSLDGVL